MDFVGTFPCSIPFAIKPILRLESVGAKLGSNHQSVLKHDQNANMMFLEPLPCSEIKATAKSIAKHCWKRDSYHYNDFIYRQALKCSKRGKVFERKPVAISEQSLNLGKFRNFQKNLL